MISSIATALAASAQPVIHTPHVDYLSILPMLIMMGGAVGLMVVSSLFRKILGVGAGTLAASAVSVAALIAALVQWDHVSTHGPQVTIAGAIAFDGFDVFVQIAVAIGMLLTALVGDGYLRREGVEGPEFHVLAMMSASGAMMMGAANDLIVVFLGLEIMSIALYVLAASNHKRTESGEAALKYFVLGAFSSAVFVYGIALVYGATGIDQPAPDRRLPREERHRVQRGAARRVGTPAGRVRVQDRSRSLPHVVARRLPGLAVPGRPASWPRWSRSAPLPRCCGCSCRRSGPCERTGSRSSGVWPCSAWCWARCWR